MFRRLWKGKSATKKTVTKSSTARKPAAKAPAANKKAKSKESYGKTAKSSRKTASSSRKTTKKAARTPAARKAVKKTATKAAKKAATKAPKKTTAKVAKKTTRKAPAKPAKQPAKKAAAGKPTKKKAVLKKKKAVSKKAPAKKARAKKVVSKRPASKRRVAKTSVKKAVARKKPIRKTVVSSGTGHRAAPQVKPPFESYKGERTYIFTSYSHRNMQEVFGIIRKLNESRYRLWYDEGIEPGNEWPEIVGRAVLRCSQFLVFMSQTAAKSRNVRNEINLAFSEDKDILVVFLEKTNLSEGMRLQIGTVQFINKFDMKENEFVEKLKKVLSSDLRN